MQTLILTLHIIVCVMLIILVLLQAGREGMGVIFGGGGGSVFGSSGAGGLLSKLTAFTAVLFLFTCLSYTYTTGARNNDDSVVLDVKLEETAPAQTAPAQTAPAQTAPAESTTKPTTDAPATEQPK